MRAFLSLYLSNLFLVGGSGLLTTYLAVLLTRDAVSTGLIGLMTSLYYLGLLLGARIGYMLIANVGHIRTFGASTAIVTACVACHGMVDNTYFWLLLRLVVGIAMMCNYMVLESWLNEQASAEQRGRIFSVYMITSYLGTMLGQWSLSYYPELGLEPLLLICLALAIGVVPLTITRRIHPKPLKPVSVSFFYFFKKAPQALMAVFFAGMISGSFYGLAPVFGQKAGFDAEQVALYMFVTVLAGFLAQWPMGVLSDRVARSALMRGNALFIAIISAFIFVLPVHQIYSFVLTFAFGLGIFTLYPLSSALANSRVDDEDRVGIASALLISFGLGAALGSGVLAKVMDMFGYASLYGATAILAFIMLIALTLINTQQDDEEPGENDYMVSASDVNASPMVSSLDPRIEEEVAQEQLMVTDEDEMLQELNEEEQQLEGEWEQLVTSVNKQRDSDG
ncbi:MFS transporter [Thalassotalea ponticola]|uniref:MFS transporter n=1 Tax=Thalassotalea ponticola TaxID=1523392 RepID=UPI0025B3E9F7|nr:MFS transporter [Thalassotalea ponticola]MDN3652363.1 MFS transporter [Thalassotalea ponticola]